MEINRLLERCLKESKCLDLESLCIVSEEKVSLQQRTSSSVADPDLDPHESALVCLSRTRIENGFESYEDGQN